MDIKMKYKNRTIRYLDILGWWMVFMPKDFDGNLEMKHFETKGECIDYIDEMHKEEEEKHCNGGYWYEKYLA